MMNVKTVFLAAMTLIASSFSVIAKDENPFRISAVREATLTDLIKVGKDWRKDLPKRIQVNLRVYRNMSPKAVKVKAYFYDKDYKLIHTASSPNRIWTETLKGVQEVLFPEELERGKAFDVYFALPEAITEKKWKAVVVVFGNSEAMVARSRPMNLIDELRFPEEGIAKKERQ